MKLNFLINMLASHNSKTFNKATNKIFELFNFIWRCQDKSLQDQYARGVRFFDIRVYRKSSNDAWGYCHGLVNVYGGAGDLKALLHLLKIVYPDVKCRIILEKYKNQETLDLFKSEVQKLLDTTPDVYDIVQQFIIKPGWVIVWNNDKMNYNIIDKSWVPFTSDKPKWKQLSWKMFSNPKRWAKKHNNITNEEINDKNVIYFYDFV